MTMRSMRPIFVAGKTGQLARSLAELAAQREVPLLAFGRPELDLEQPNKIKHLVAALRPSAIINAAAYTAVDQAEFDPERALAVNRDEAALLAAAAAKFRIPFIHVSTDYVFDGRKASPYQESDDAPASSRPAGENRSGETEERNLGLRLPVWQLSLESCLDELAMEEDVSRRLRNTALSAPLSVSKQLLPITGTPVTQ